MIWEARTRRSGGRTPGCGSGWGGIVLS
jgi:hypothetical protein